MTRERKIQIMMELLDEQAVSIPAYLEEDYQRAIDAAFQKIEKLESREGVRLDKNGPQRRQPRRIQNEIKTNTP